MTTCEHHMYRPEQAIEALYDHYVRKGNSPAVDADGRMLYSAETVGCAVFVLASEPMREALRNTTHEQTPACSRRAGDVIEGRWDWDEINDGDRAFMTALQLCHDIAAEQATVNGTVDHDRFCDILVSGLRQTCLQFAAASTPEQAERLRALAAGLPSRARPQLVPA